MHEERNDFTEGCRVQDSTRLGMIVPWPASVGARADGAVRVRWNDGDEQTVSAARLTLLARAHYAEPAEVMARLTLVDAQVASRCLNLSEFLRMPGDDLERGDFDSICQDVSLKITVARRETESAMERTLAANGTRPRHDSQGPRNA